MNPQLSPTQFNPIELLYQTPLLLLVLSGLLVVLAAAFFRGDDRVASRRSGARSSSLPSGASGRSHLMGMTVAGCVAAAIAAVVMYKMLAPGQQQVLMYGMLVMDRFACFFIVLLSLATAMTAMMSQRYQEEHGWESGEYYALLLLVAAGMGIMAMANDLVTVFLGIETMSLGVYVLVAIRPRSLRGTEAAMKYFLMGAVATAFLLYGIALIYGATGATNLQEIKLRLGEVNELGLLISGIFLMIVAMGFKVAAVPFHMWAPDAYEGAPTPVTGFMAAAVKAAAFAVVLRLFGDTFGGEIMAFGRMGWASPLVVLAAVTITVGNLAALRQENIKRMLAYSSISHAGILLVGVIAVGLGDAARAQPGVLYYLAAYTLTTLGAFAVVAWVGSRGRERVLIDDWAGLAAKHPGAALAMTIFMLSLGGIPPTGGFFGKFYVFKSAMEAHDQQLTWLVAVGVVNAAISIYYYLRVVMAMYFRPAVDEFQPLRSGAITVVLVICALAILEMGILPGFWLGVAGG